MILSPSQEIWTPAASRFGAWWRKAKEWRASIATYMAEHLRADPSTGHLTYKSSGGHLVYGCPPISCLYCTGNSTTRLQVVIAGVTNCTGCQHGSGATNFATISSTLNGTYTLARPDAADSPCFYELDSIGAVADVYNNSSCTTGHIVNPFNISVSYGDAGTDFGRGIVYIVASTGALWYGFYGEFTGIACAGPIVVSNLLTTCGVDPGFPDTLATGGTATITTI